MNDIRLCERQVKMTLVNLTNHTGLDASRGCMLAARHSGDQAIIRTLVRLVERLVVLNFGRNLAASQTRCSLTR
jgi:hypothetical protein